MIRTAEHVDDERPGAERRQNGARPCTQPPSGMASDDGAERAADADQQDGSQRAHLRRCPGRRAARGAAPARDRHGYRADRQWQSSGRTTKGLARRRAAQAFRLALSDSAARSSGPSGRISNTSCGHTPTHSPFASQRLRSHDRRDPARCARRPPRPLVPCMLRRPFGAPC